MALSQMQRDYARLLHQRGKTGLYIAKQLGITSGRVSQISKKEGWAEDLLPKFTRQELVDNAEILVFRQQLSMLLGKEEDSTRAALNHAKLVEALNKLEEGNSATSTRNRMAGLEDAMRHFMAEGKTTLTIEDLQELYDKTMEEL